MCKAIRLLIYTFVVMTVVLTSIPTQQGSDEVAYAQGAFGRRATGSTDNSDSSNQAAEDAKKREEEARKAAEEKRRQEEEARQAEVKRREDEERRAAESRRAEETRRREQEARDAETRRQEEARNAELRRQQEEREAENRRQQEARDAENRRREQEARDANNRREQEARAAEAREAAARRDREESARQAELRRQQDEERRNDEARVAAARRADEERRRAQEAAARPVDVRPTDRNDHRRGNTKKYDRVGDRPRPPKEYYPDYYPYDPYYTVINTGGAPVIIYPSSASPSPYWDRSSIVIVDDYPVTVIPSIYTVTADENPIPRDADDALILLRRCWIERSPALMWWLMPHNDYIDIVEDGVVTSRMKANDFYTLTCDAVSKVETEVFWFRTVERRGEYVVASGVHTYRGADDVLRRCDMTYTLARRGGRWVIVQTGFGPIVTSSVVYRGLTLQESRLIFMRLSPMAIFAGFPNRAISLGAMCAIPFF